MSYSKQEMFIAYGKLKGINIGKIDLRNDNYMDNKIIDLNNFMFNKNTYKEYLVPLIKKGGAWLSNTPYHTIDELDIVGTRKITDRPKELCLDEIDFNGKTVLDIGSAMGNMVREYSERGAKRVVGVDINYYPEISKQIDYYLGYFNNDYYGYNEDINLSKDQLNNIIKLRSQTNIVKYDILSFLSVVNHVPFTRDVAFLADTIIFEGHAQNTEEQIERWLEPYYNKVTKIKGRSKLNNRLAYIGTNL